MFPSILRYVLNTFTVKCDGVWRCWAVCLVPKDVPVFSLDAQIISAQRQERH